MYTLFLIINDKTGLTLIKKEFNIKRFETLYRNSLLAQHTQQTGHSFDIDSNPCRLIADAFHQEKNSINDNNALLRLSL